MRKRRSWKARKFAEYVKSTRKHAPPSPSNPLATDAARIELTESAPKRKGRKNAAR